MGHLPGALENWLDGEFFKRGAFLTSTDGQTITFAKGGEITVVEEFLATDVPVFYLKDFYQGQYLAFVPDSILTIGKSNVLGYLKDQSEKQTPLSPIENDDDLYEKDFGLLKTSFSESLKKVVLISRETYEPFEGKETIRRLMRRSFEFGAGLPYGLWNESYGVIGSTPEVLFEVKNKTLSTFALAGTGKKGEEEELLHSSKDRHEHELVVQDIREKLSGFTSDLAVYKTEVVPYNSLIHLKTDIVARILPDTDFTELTNTLSPTAALGGYPKEASLKFLQGTHYFAKYQKRYFGSCFGLMARDMKQFVVSIRNVQWEGQHLFIESGGGIVSQSLFEKEFEEVHLKRNTIRKHYL